MTRPSPQTERVVALIDLMVGRPDQAFTLAEVSRRLGVHKQTCHSMLQTLTGAGWLIRHPSEKTYRLGPVLVAAGRAAEAGSPILEYAHATMHTLAQEIGATCELIERVGSELILADAAMPRGRSLAPLSIGQVFPLLAPLGGIFVAWQGVAGFEMWTAEVATESLDAFRDATSVIRSLGFEVRLHRPLEGMLRELQDKLGAVETGGESVGVLLSQFVGGLLGQPDELLGNIEPRMRYPVASVSAPVFDNAGSVRHALTMSFRIGSELTGAELLRIGRRVRAATDDLTVAIGGARPPASAG